MKLIHFQVDQALVEERLLELANLNRLYVYQADETLFEALDFDSNAIFLEPALFFNQTLLQEGKPFLPVSQILWGHIPDSAKPSRIKVKTCAEGLVALPNFGYLITCLPCQDLELHYAGSDDAILLFTLSGKQIDFAMQPETILGTSSIRVLKSKAFIYDYLSIKTDEAIAESVDRAMPSLENAYALLQAATPEYCALIERCTREIAVFSSPNFNSFASRMHYGTSFLNCENRLCDPIFFLDDLAHQVGHTVFDALTLDHGAILAVDKDTHIKSVSTTYVEQEHRTVYFALHGLFTYTAIIHCLDQGLKKRLFNDRQALDAIGRIGFYMRKFRYDLQQLNHPQLYTPEGYEFVKMFQASYEEIAVNYQKFPPVNYDNQSYTFQYDSFVEINSIYKDFTAEKITSFIKSGVTLDL
jgi:hypothetical protein